jgi:hypothetical protein
MAGTKSKQAIGHITIVQEQRFRLLTEEGQGFLFSVSHTCPLDPVDLDGLREKHSPVVVEYEGEPDLATAIAYRVRAIPFPEEQPS